MWSYSTFVFVDIVKDCNTGVSIVVDEGADDDDDKGVFTEGVGLGRWVMSALEGLHCPMQHVVRSQLPVRSRAVSLPFPFALLRFHFDFCFLLLWIYERFFCSKAFESLSKCHCVVDQEREKSSQGRAVSRRIKYNFLHYATPCCTTFPLHHIDSCSVLSLLLIHE